MRRAGLVLCALLAAPLVGSATARAATALSVGDVEVAGQGPGDVVHVRAVGFRVNSSVDVTLDSATASRALTTAGADATGAVDLPVGTRIPLDATPGSYRLTLTQEGGGAVSSRPFVVTPPAVTVPEYVLPGQPTARAIPELCLGLQGLANTPDVVRTVSIDGVQVVSTWFTEDPAVFYNPGVAFEAPEDLAVGNHRLTFTQTGPTPFTFTGTVVVGQAVLVTSGPYVSTGRIFVNIVHAAWDEDADLTVVGAAGDRHTGLRWQSGRTPTGGASTGAVSLVGVSSGTATMTSVSRRNGATAVTTFVIDPASVTSPGGLAPGQRIVTPNGDTQLVMQTDGNLVYGTPGDRPAWSTRTFGHPGAHLVVQPDGNVVVYDIRGTALWNTGTAGIGSGVRFGFDTQREVGVYTATGRRAWSSFVYGNYRLLTQLSANQYLFKGQSLTANLMGSPGGRVYLTVQPDGNMVVHTDHQGVLWSTRTFGHPNAYLVLQADGNLVVHAADGTVLWADYAKASGARLVAQNDGNVVEYAPNGTALWSTRTVVR